MFGVKMAARIAFGARPFPNSSVSKSYSTIGTVDRTRSKLVITVIVVH